VSAIADEMETITVTLKRVQVDALRALAEDHGVSIDELIADGISQLLMTLEEDDPLFQIIGMIKDGPTDMARNHDAYLAEMYDKERRSVS
jgi:hypothetical protein